MKTEVARAEFSGPAAALSRLRSIEADLRAVGRITGQVEWAESESESIDVAVELVTQA